MVDGFTWQGFKVNSNLNIRKNQPGMGLRQVLGNDPANPQTDSFSLGQGTPQVWEPNNCAAGVAFCEVRITKPSTIQPSTPDQHQMTVALDYGLSGYVWDQNGNRSVVAGLINPFWIAVNMLLRATGLTASLEAPLDRWPSPKRASARRSSRCTRRSRSSRRRPLSWTSSSPRLAAAWRSWTS
jgi:hypothetical protein